MTKKNLKPQQAAPVQREINTTSSESGMGLTPLFKTKCTPDNKWWAGDCNPFAGDDAE
jgi:prenylated cyclic peptide (anacyclamide/piricyclamide family)